MINFISSWLQGIVISVIISTIVEMILPDGNIKKYVKTVIGAYIVFVIVSPIISKLTGKEINLDFLQISETKQYQTTSIDTNSYIENTYINKMEKDIIENVDKEGYKVSKVKIAINTEEESYGEITKIELKISKTNNENTIKKISIDVNNKIDENKKIENDEIEKLKEFLKENYGTEKQFIYIEYY